MMVPWRISAPPRIDVHTVAPGGQHVLSGSHNGALTLLDRRGKARWDFLLPAPIYTVTSDGPPEVFAAGTWDGQVRVYLPEGFAWNRQIHGVVSALAVSAQGGRLAAGSWAGRLHLFGLDGTALSEHTLPEAILHVAMHPSGQPVIAALEGGRILAIDSNGERWNSEAGAEVQLLAAFGHEILAVTPAGLTWLDYEGHSVRQCASAAAVTHAAVSTSGSWAAWVEGGQTLHFLHPDSRAGWSTPLPAVPDALTVAGDGASPVLMVALPSARLWVFNRWQVRLEETLPERVSSLSASRWGTEAVAVSLEGDALFLQEFPAIRKWLPPPRVEVRVQAGHLAAQQAGTLALDITNEGARAARGIEITIESEFLRLPRSTSLEELAPEETRRIRVAVEPVKAGELLLGISVQYADEAGEGFRKTFEAVARVVPG